MKWLTGINDLRVLLGIALKKPPSTASSSPEVFFLDPDYQPLITSKPVPVKPQHVFSVTRANLIGLLLLMMCIVPIPLVFMTGIQQDAQLAQRGIRTTATVLMCEVERSQRPFLTYTYTATYPDGRQAAVTDTGFAGYFQRCVPDYSTVEIEYLPEDPMTTRLISPGLYAGFSDQALLIVTSIPAVALLAGLVWGAGQYLRDVRRYRLFRSKGTILPGRVAGSRWLAEKSYTLLEVEYEFTTPAGTLLNGKQSCLRIDLHPDRRPAVGTPCYVLYATDTVFMLC